MDVSIDPRLTTALGERYALEAELGSGGYARVLLAFDRKHDRRVAVLYAPGCTGINGVAREESCNDPCAQ